MNVRLGLLPPPETQLLRQFPVSAATRPGRVADLSDASLSFLISSLVTYEENVYVRQHV